MPDNLTKEAAEVMAEVEARVSSPENVVLEKLSQKFADEIRPLVRYCLAMGATPDEAVATIGDELVAQMRSAIKQTLGDSF